jgi:hypothetical protein
MTLPLMPKATAVWLVENTTLAFDQIAEFCGLHPLEIQGIADGDVANGIKGLDPIQRGFLSRENIEAAEKDEKVKLVINSDFKDFIDIEKKRKKSKFTPVARRLDKPDAIAWLVKTHSKITDAQIAKLVGTTKKTIQDIRNKTYWNMANLRPRDPVLLGICTQTALQAVLDKIERENPTQQSA